MMLFFLLAACRTDKEASCFKYEEISAPQLKPLRLLADESAGRDETKARAALDALADRGRNFSLALADQSFGDPVVRGKVEAHRGLLEQYPGTIMDLDGANRQGDTDVSQAKMKAIAGLTEREFATAQEIRNYCGPPKE